MGKVFSILIFFMMGSQAIGSEIPFYSKKDFSPLWDEAAIKKEALIEMPQFTLKDHNGKTFVSKQLDSKLTVVNFFYASCPGICPAAMSRLGQTKEKLKEIKDVRFVSFSITPAVDTPGIMKAFAEKRGLPLDNWYLLSGKESEIQKITSLFQANKDVPSKAPGEFVHSENIFLLDQHQRLRGIYNVSSRADLKLLVKDVKALRWD